MKPSSAKNKGRLLQNWVRDQILLKFNSLSIHDVKGASAGQTGIDILLSTAARLLFPYAVECKSLASAAIYTHYDQALSNATGLEPVVIIKANRRKPLAVVDAEYFINLAKAIADS